eukprot:COSAG02_NODE_2271_length_9264_cov_2.764539_3_plen_158_part_00
MVSTGRFQHPITRGELSLNECSALDAYLLRYKLGKAQVVHAYEHRHEYTTDVPTADNRLARIRAEATEILAALFAGGTEHPSTEPDEASQGRNAAGSQFAGMSARERAAAARAAARTSNGVAESSNHGDASTHRQSRCDAVNKPLQQLNQSAITVVA